ncbi:MAG: multiheme c-type cytochrome [Acidobacteriota bacterium]
MQPFRPDLPGLVPPGSPIQAQGATYRVVFAADRAELFSLDAPGTRYPLQWALGGKNVYYFLTELEKGRLQVLPVAFDVREGSWFDAMGSMVRHFHNEEDEPLPWTDRRLTFNTSCFHCHVSQLAKNYDPGTDSYATQWREPGVNCETCHGPGGEHAAWFRAHQEEGSVPQDLKILSTKQLPPDRVDALCASCHAKLFPVSAGFVPGEPFFDHFGLVTLEDLDFYPDGRDLGENYTFTAWLMNPCARAGELHCLHCHTSSGRDRHGEDPDQACMPCHQELVANPEPHTHHPADSDGSRCAGCHLPRTSFARMVRHDHSLRPPAPAATLAFGSPNACNLCHTDQDAAWADRWARRWYGNTYQERILQAGRLIQAARQRRWEELPEMAAYLRSRDRDPVVTASLLLLLRDYPGTEKWELLEPLLADGSPLVRRAAVSLLADAPAETALRPLEQAANDPRRLVRFAAAVALVEHARLLEAPQVRSRFAALLQEYRSGLEARPDDWTAQYNLGNLLLRLEQRPAALAAFVQACRVGPPVAAPWVNRSIVAAELGRVQEAEEALREGLAVFPDDAALHFNLGLLLAERGDLEAAESHLRKAWEADPRLAAAAYNLAVLLAERGDREALAWARRAAHAAPDVPRYPYTLAFYLAQFGELEKAIAELRRMVAAGHADAPAYLLLAELLARSGRLDESTAVLRRATEDPRLAEQDRAWFTAQLLRTAPPAGDE